MKSYRCYNVGTRHVARSRNSSGHEPQVPGDYRIGCPEGGDHAEVSWTSDTRVGGVSELVDLFRTTFLSEINSSGYFYSIGQIMGQMVRRGGGSIFGMLGGCGRATDTVVVFVEFSEQLSCINYFNPSYGLKYIDFISLINFKTFIIIFHFFYSLINIINNQF